MISFAFESGRQGHGRSGHKGDACITGFASRKPDLTLYIAPGFLASEALMGKLGKHKTGKS